MWERLPEFLVFHHQRGIEHFYIYDGSQDAVVATALKNFIDAGLVTAVEWPYTDCDMDHVTRDVHFEYTNEAGEKIKEWVGGLPDMSHRAALDSCFTRFSQFTTWLGSWDIDEFVVPLSTTTYKDLLAPYTNDNDVASVSIPMVFHMPSSFCSANERTQITLRNPDKPLRASDGTSAEDRLAALAHEVSGDSGNHATASICPETEMFHLGSWCFTDTTDHQFEPKQFYKTSHVQSHMIHYLGAHTHGSKVEIDRNTARLSHFKLPDPHFCASGNGAAPATDKCLDYIAPLQNCPPHLIEIDTTSAAQYLPQLKEGLLHWYPNLRPEVVGDDKHDHDQYTKQQAAFVYRKMTTSVTEEERGTSS
jgi:hypothetical protein